MPQLTKTKKQSILLHAQKRRLTGFTSMIMVVVISVSLLMSLNTTAQTTTYPTISPSSCTSKDLELLEAKLEGVDFCDVPEGNKRLVLKIYNKTGSTRTSFALWGKLFVDGNQTEIAFACAGPIEGNSIGTFPTEYYIYYTPGSRYVIKDLFLAWTTANKKDTCGVLAANPNLISPKCGTLDSIVIPSGVGATVNATQAVCLTGKGNISVSPRGGVGPYQVAIYNGATREDSVLAAVGSTLNFPKDPGNYTVYIYDSRPCRMSYNTSVAAPTPLATPISTPTSPGCYQTTGSVSITSYNAAYTYYIYVGTDTSFFTSSSKSGVSPGTYSFEVRQGVCKTAGSSVVINPPPPTPNPPTGLITQPSLCGPQKAIVTIQSPTSGDGAPFTYSIDSTTWQSSTEFSNLNPGSSPRFWVKNSYGCISNGASSCGFTSNFPPSLIENKLTSEQKGTTATRPQEPRSLGAGTMESSVTVKAVPNPFGNRVRFLITTEESGNGVLEIYNMQGQKLKTVFQGYVPAGSNFYDLTVPAKRRAELIYVFRKGTEQFSGKLLQLDKE